MDNNNQSELERQLAMIEGLNLEPDVSNSIKPQPQVAVETADTLLGNVPFGSVTAPINNIAQQVTPPSTPENPTNAGIITNSVVPQSLEANNVIAQPVNAQQVAQNQANMQAAAQVVQQSQTGVSAQVIAQPQLATVQEQPQVVDMNAAPVFVNLSESTYETKTDFLKLKEGEATRVTLINYNAVSTHEHFKEGLGFFKCKSTYELGQRWPSVRAICCQQPSKDNPSRFENASYKILLPVIEYPVNHNDGKTLISDGTPKLKVIKLSQQESKQLEAIRNGYGEDTSIFDISISRKKDNGYLKYFLTPIPSWRNQFAQAINEESSKLTNETYNVAVQESAKDISIERLQQFYMEQKQQEQMANQLANQQMIDPASLGLNI